MAATAGANYNPVVALDVFLVQVGRREVGPSGWAEGPRVCVRRRPEYCARAADVRDGMHTCTDHPLFRNPVMPEVIATR